MVCAIKCNAALPLFSTGISYACSMAKVYCLDTGNMHSVQSHKMHFSGIIDIYLCHKKCVIIPGENHVNTDT